jgi:hypothetical protein
MARQNGYKVTVNVELNDEALHGLYEFCFREFEPDPIMYGLSDERKIIMQECMSDTLRACLSEFVEVST